MNRFYTRLIQISSEETFFLWGPRQSGKTTLLKTLFPEALWIDLLLPQVYRRYMTQPELLIEEVTLNTPSLVVIDEIQKVPQLLDSVHWLIENRGTRFALCGSSARKVKRGHANLLGGRGLRFEMYGLCAREIGSEVDFLTLLNHGYIPRIYESRQPKRYLNAYVSQYLKEEIAEEGLVRNLPAFSEFLNLSALCDTAPVNFSTIARDIGVAVTTVKGYYEILEDTLLGRFLPSYKARPKRRISTSPKFYFFDVGVVNFLAKRGNLEMGSELMGKAFENWVFHELVCYNSYREIYAELFTWRLSSGLEVDFIVNHIDCAIEAKASTRIRSHHLKGLRELRKEHPQTKKLVLVSFDEHSRTSEDGILMLHASRFIDMLWNGELF